MVNEEIPGVLVSFNQPVCPAEKVCGTVDLGEQLHELKTPFLTS